MIRYSFHASHEQFSPSHLLTLTKQAQVAGFDGVFCSDHLQPWSPSQGHSGHTWTWLGAAMQATQGLAFSCITVPCGWRYHPVVLAQAVATLCDMYPDRMPWLALGSGEALNEASLGYAWPSKAERHARLREGADAMRTLLSGERIQRKGHWSLSDARLWDVPIKVPLLLGAATTEATASWLGSWADGLLTMGRDLKRLQTIIEAFREGGGHGKPVHVKLDISWDHDVEAALREAHAQWRFNSMGSAVNAELRQPEHFNEAARFLRPDDMHESVLITSSASELLDHLEALEAMGIGWVDIHQVSLLQTPFIEWFGQEVQPTLASRRTCLDAPLRSAQTPNQHGEAQ